LALPGLVALALRLLDLAGGLLKPTRRVRGPGRGLPAALECLVPAADEDRVQLAPHLARLLGLAGVPLHRADERQVRLAGLLEAVVLPHRLAVFEEQVRV